jgi:predicted nucleotidyltransferase
LEPPELLLGLDKQDFYVWSTAGDERRNGPDDVDVCLYSLRKWAGLAAKGNPTALHFLFSHNYSAKPKPWDEILKKSEVFLSRQAALQFRGFAEAQVRRLQGIGTGKKGQRHELIGVHGYDIKAAMHVIRLLNEGIELTRSGTITLPRPEKELLITIRTGNYGSLERVLTLANTLFVELEQAEAKSGLPQKVDRTRVSKLVSDTYLSHWTG